ncbi:hypothetical protein GCM10009754_72710 [Amycolatopsis minnesotensis]|uniref:Uncharacterized protein n=1 Tax=Amycolatopsis minnesotensis TaxID=337894 RepID=A0ABN2SFG6_9PSEU
MPVRPRVPHVERAARLRPGTPDGMRVERERQPIPLERHPADPHHSLPNPTLGPGHPHTPGQHKHRHY